jgi:DNA-binding Lrp family transcriptional regulator
MDNFDLKLLDALQADGRLTNQELAEQVGLSASQCSRRRSALEAAGIIAGYHAHLDSAAVALDVLVFVQVTLSTHSADNARRFRHLINQLDEVQEAYAMTGTTDYHLKLIVPDLSALSRILNDVFLQHDSVQNVHSFIVLESLKKTSRLPLKHLRQ